MNRRHKSGLLSLAKEGGFFKDGQFTFFCFVITLFKQEQPKQRVLILMRNEIESHTEKKRIQ